jgi:hypothetical protein
MLLSRRLQSILEEDLDQHQKFDNKDYMTYFTYGPSFHRPPRARAHYRNC